MFFFVIGAREDVYGVIVGGVLGHAICTGLAVIGGRMIAQRISVRTGIIYMCFLFKEMFFIFFSSLSYIGWRCCFSTVRAECIVLQSRRREANCKSLIYFLLYQSQRYV